MLLRPAALDDVLVCELERSLAPIALPARGAGIDFRSAGIDFVGGFAFVTKS